MDYILLAMGLFLVGPAIILGAATVYATIVYGLAVLEWLRSSTAELRERTNHDFSQRGGSHVGLRSNPQGRPAQAHRGAPTSPGW